MDPLITADMVGLRSLESPDFPYLHKWFNAPRVRESMGARRCPDFVSMEEERRIVEGKLRDPEQMNFIIHHLRRNAPVGIASLVNMNRRTASAELQLVVGEADLWGQGICQETVRLLLDHAFQVHNLHRVHLRVAERDRGAVSCYRRCGFVEEGRARHDHFSGGEWRDSLLMSVIRGD
ncbi:MAG: GNAT family N-acetyltransferase [Methanomassiliicoccales archaeon]